MNDLSILTNLKMKMSVGTLVTLYSSTNSSRLSNHTNNSIAETSDGWSIIYSLMVYVKMLVIVYMRESEGSQLSQINISPN